MGYQFQVEDLIIRIGFTLTYIEVIGYNSQVFYFF